MNCISRDFKSWKIYDPGTNLVPGEVLLPHRRPLSLAPHVTDCAMDLLEFSFGKSLISTYESSTSIT